MGSVPQLLFGMAWRPQGYSVVQTLCQQYPSRSAVYFIKFIHFIKKTDDDDDNDDDDEEDDDW